MVIAILSVKPTILVARPSSVSCIVIGGFSSVVKYFLIAASSVLS